MSPAISELAAQLVAEIDARHVEPIERMTDPMVRTWILQRLEDIAEARVLPLLDDVEGYETAIEILYLTHGHQDPDPAWWSTPLGRACGAALGQDDVTLSYSQAGAILGVTKGTIGKLVERGTLPRHPDGGIPRSAVLARRRRLDQPQV